MSDRTNDETQQQSRLIRVPVKDLRPGMYVHDLGVHWGMHPFLHNQFELDQGAVEKVRALGVKRIVVDLLRSKPSAFRALSAGNEDRAVAEEEVYAGDPGEITRAARQVIRSLLADARAGKALDMQLVKEASRELSKALTHHRNTMLALGRIRSRDGYTYQHSVNCGVLFMAFAKYLDMPTEKVRMLGTAGMLHDIGKAFVPEQILTKPSKLSDEEYKTIQTHPAKGGELLRNTDGVHPLVIQVAEQHHERMNGSGYPCRLEQKHLRLEVRMASIIDVYDAITAVRSYHQGRPPPRGWGSSSNRLGRPSTNTWPSASSTASASTRRVRWSG